MLKIDYPKLKRTQRLQMMKKEFEKHPDNPYNKKNNVAYNYNPKKEDKGEENKGEWKHFDKKLDGIYCQK